MRWLAALVCLAAGCDTGVSVDNVRDGATPDVAMRDLAPPPDLTILPPDLALVDFAKPPTTAQYAGCANAFQDFTQGAGPTITFPNNINVPSYQPQCVTVTTQQTVSWMGDFSSHPLLFASSNTVAVTPMFTAKMVQQVQFTTPGFYGYYCEVHGTDDGVGMAGNVQVLP